MAAVQSSKNPAKKAGQSAAAGKTDAIALLEAQHKEVKGWFEQFEKTDSDARKGELFGKICTALKAHTRVEEEIFYPEARLATGEEDLLDEAIVEHQAAKQLLSQIEAMSPGDDFYDAKVKVLGEEIDHHVQEEETELFPKCRKSDMDLETLGVRMAARFKVLTAELSGRAPTRQ